MRALTLTQPWCGLVAAGVKLVENRPRPMIKRADFGVPFALHASREIDEIVYDRIAEIAPELVRGAAGAVCKAQSLLAEVPWLALAGVTSAVIGVATIVRTVTASEVETGALDAYPNQRRWFFGPVGYVLRDVRALHEPVPCRGWQGFWTLPDDVAARVEEQLR